MSRPADSVHAPLPRFSAVHGQTPAGRIFGTPHAPPAPAPQATTHADYLAELRAGGVSAICNDGTLSYSRNRSGTCSHHGGVREGTGLI